jgi:hypothetical protein
MEEQVLGARLLGPVALRDHHTLCPCQHDRRLHISEHAIIVLADQLLLLRLVSIVLLSGETVPGHLVLVTGASLGGWAVELAFVKVALVNSGPTSTSAFLVCQTSQVPSLISLHHRCS